MAEIDWSDLCVELHDLSDLLMRDCDKDRQGVADECRAIAERIAPAVDKEDDPEMTYLAKLEKRVQALEKHVGRLITSHPRHRGYCLSGGKPTGQHNHGINPPSEIAQLKKDVSRIVLAAMPEGAKRNAYIRDTINDIVVTILKAKVAFTVLADAEGA